MKIKATKIDFYRTIVNSPGRFLSILLIVMLGVAFFSGIRAAEPAMRVTADAYFDSEKLMDIRVMSTYGVTKEDIQAFCDMEDISQAEGGYSADFLSEIDNEQGVLHVMSSLSDMNKVSVSEGRMPKEVGECLADSLMSYKVGDRIELTSGNEDAVTDTLKTDQMTVVGVGSIPNYISYGRGSSLIGTGSISGFLIVPSDTFELEVYTEGYLRVAGADQKEAYTEGYREKTESVLKKVEKEVVKRGIIRKEEIVAEAQEKVDDAERELEEGRTEMEEELSEAKSQIEDARNQIRDGEQEIADGEAQLWTAQTQLTRKQQELEGKRIELDSGKAVFEQEKEKALEQIRSGREQMQLLSQQINADHSAKQALQQQIDELIRTGAPQEQIAPLQEQMAMLEQKIQVEQQTYDTTTAQLNASEQQLAAKESELESAEQQIAAGQEQINAGWRQISIQNQNIQNGRSLLAENATKLKKAEEDYQEGKAEGEKEIAEGEQKIEDAKKEIADIEDPEWFVDDRNTLPEYEGLGDNAERIKAIGKVFPVLFFLVAALISLTSMTRMIEEQRMLIGTMKALGYRRFAIAGKYIGYAFAATMIGSILGVLAGEKVIPYIIIHAYGILYHHINNILTPYHWGYGLAASGIAIACTTGATLMSCLAALRAQPSVLMRPPSPKLGKRVFLERIPLIWKNLSFTSKSTVRNLVRYKKRLSMTIFGIGGCMALILVGFGLRDSIYEIADLQYSQLQMYNGTVYLKDDRSQEEREELYRFLSDDNDLESFLPVSFKQVTGENDGEKREFFECVLPSVEEGEKYLLLRDRRSKQEYTLGDDGVIMSEKTAKLLNVKKGQSFVVQDGEKDQVTVRVAEICENYMGHYVYFSPEYFKKAYGREPEYNSVLFLMDPSFEKDQMEQAGRKIVERDEVLSIGYTHDIEKQLNDMLKSLNLVIVVLIVSAGMLSFVVLYNLNNINITERKRELATLKVLGFFDMEVAEYVYRENIILTFAGALAGVALGRALHLFVIQTVEVDAAMFGRIINFPSYIYSLLLTVAFSLFVNGVMYFKLKRIDMVESLKSIE